ncbi:probable hexosyltransferase MUCI70 [Aristolochia californica]|uniref:probable hexosyltransferase MUCI70 n=1 Tax=Aristolochia californica TaxID=171875 RepID=UPI0035DB80D2
MYNNFSISVSDDDSDDLIGRMRVRVRRRRRRLGFRAKNETFRQIRRIGQKWWSVLLFLSVMALILFQLPRTGVKPTEERKADLDVGSELTNLSVAGGTEKPSNLNRLDQVTRVVSGVREPCLKLLPAEELRHLEFPPIVAPDSPIRRIIYKGDFDETRIGGSGNALQEYTDGTRFNKFTGNQTFIERQESFKVSETAAVHCGFYSENGGFRISEEDKHFMRTCEAVVSTCAFGGGDDLYQPIGMVEESLSKVCYVAFWDEITKSAQEAQGKRIGADRMIGKWRIVVVRDLPFTDQRLNGKIPKLLSHRLFPQARYSIWVDSKSQLRRDPMGVLEALLWRTNSVFAISEHGARSDVYNEGNAIVRKHKATPEEVEIQLTQYRRDGFPDDKRYRGKRALAEASIIVREHTPSTNLFTCLWFNEVVRFTSRDQLSFPYVLRQLGVLKINMFPVCTRKDLVNSMGHKRKVKPLTG